MKQISILVIGIVIFCACKKESKDECPTDPLANTIIHNDEQREYLIYIPTTYDGTSAVPLMLNFHGFGGNARDYMLSADMRTQAEADTFILVYPQGSCIDGASHWNSSLPGGDNKSSADDLGFVESLVNNLVSTYNIDLERVYACGYSNGGMMAFGLAQHKSDLIAAVGSVSGTMLDSGNSPNRPVPVITIHGTADGVLPYNGSAEYNSVSNVLDYWVNFNNTNVTPQITNLTSGAYQIEHQLFTDGDSSSTVEHYKIISGDHVWFDLSINGSSTSDLIWNFVSQYDINGLN